MQLSFVALRIRADKDNGILKFSQLKPDIGTDTPSLIGKAAYLRQ